MAGALAALIGFVRPVDRGERAHSERHGGDASNTDDGERNNRLQQHHPVATAIVTALHRALRLVDQWPGSSRRQRGHRAAQSRQSFESREQSRLSRLGPTEPPNRGLERSRVKQRSESAPGALTGTRGQQLQT